MTETEQPDVPAMLTLLDEAYQALSEQQPSWPEECPRLLTASSDLRWSALLLFSSRFDCYPADSANERSTPGQH